MRILTLFIGVSMIVVGIIQFSFGEHYSLPYDLMLFTENSPPASAEPTPVQNVPATLLGGMVTAGGIGLVALVMATTKKTMFND
ncbi:MAG: hypothetical protein KTR14_08920 [Vampirovibrio sp.]|nr:hypothetical protein [Vampirovibrio sp.]